MRQLEKCPGSGKKTSTGTCRSCRRVMLPTRDGRVRFHKRLKQKDRRVTWRERHPLKYAAQQAVKRAIKAGSLVSEPCLFCDDPNTQAHHHDYTRPLVVTWLCAWHHHLAHGRTRPRRVQAAAA